MLLLKPSYSLQSFYDFCRIPSDNGIGLHVLRDNGTACHHCVFTDGHARQDKGTPSNLCSFFNDNRFVKHPFAFTEIMVGGHQHHIRAYLYVIFDDDTSARHHAAIIIDEDILADFQPACHIYMEWLHNMG